MTTETIAAQNEWLRIGAREKARSVQLLTRGLDVKTLLEVGSGTGAILKELDDGGFDADMYAVEPSSALYAFLTSEAAISRLVDSDEAVLAASRLAQRHYDLVLVSHVLEHVEDPAALLMQCLAIGDHVLIEVPLEGNALSNLRAAVRARLTGLPRERNAAGHIQFFSIAGMNKLVHWCGGEVVSSRAYFPSSEINALAASQTGLRKAYSQGIDRAARVVGNERWARIYHGHYAALVRRRAARAEDDRSNANNTYFYEEPAA
jgi:SAM-dependent methyltransferase